MGARTMRVHSPQYEYEVGYTAGLRAYCRPKCEKSSEALGFWDGYRECKRLGLVPGNHHV